MGAMKSNSRWGLLIAAALLSLSSSGCMITDSYAFRPTNWFVHNLFPSTCKTCPGGLPGPDGCRTFKDPWCAGYQTTMWRELGTDCGPARLPTALALADQHQPTPAVESSEETPSGDQPPALPDNFPNLLPNNPGPIRTPLPELPLDGLGTEPEDNPFPVKKVPSTPDNMPTEPDDGPPKVSPDLFPESRPNTGKPAPKSPVVVPDNIDDLFSPPKSDPPNSKVPSTLPPAKPPATPLPNLEDEKSSETLPEPEDKPAPKTSKPTVPFEETPSLEDSPDLFPEPNKKPADTKEKEKQPSVPKLFEDSSYNHLRPVSESHATVRFGQIMPVTAINDVGFKVQPAGGTVELQEWPIEGGLYDTTPTRVEPSLRILPR